MYILYINTLRICAFTFYISIHSGPEALAAIDKFEIQRRREEEQRRKEYEAERQRLRAKEEERRAAQRREKEEARRAAKRRAKEAKRKAAQRKKNDENDVLAPLPAVEDRIDGLSLDDLKCPDDDVPTQLTYRAFMDNEYTKIWVDKCLYGDLHQFNMDFMHLIAKADEIYSWAHRNCNSQVFNAQTVLENLKLAFGLPPDLAKVQHEESWDFLRIFTKEWRKQWFAIRDDGITWKARTHDENLFIYFIKWYLCRHFGAILVRRARMVNDGFQFAKQPVDATSRKPVYKQASYQEVREALMILDIDVAERKEREERKERARRKETLATANAKDTQSKPSYAARFGFEKSLDGPSLAETGRAAKHDDDGKYEENDNDEDVEDELKKDGLVTPAGNFNNDNNKLTFDVNGNLVKADKNAKDDKDYKDYDDKDDKDVGGDKDKAVGTQDEYEYSEEEDDDEAVGRDNDKDIGRNDGEDNVKGDPRADGLTRDGLTRVKEDDRRIDLRCGDLLKADGTQNEYEYSEEDDDDEAVGRDNDKERVAANLDMDLCGDAGASDNESFIQI